MNFGGIFGRMKKSLLVATILSVGLISGAANNAHAAEVRRAVNPEVIIDMGALDDLEPAPVKKSKKKKGANGAVEGTVWTEQPATTPGTRRVTRDQQPQARQITIAKPPSPMSSSSATSVELNPVGNSTPPIVAPAPNAQMPQVPQLEVKPQMPRTVSVKPPAAPAPMPQIEMPAPPPPKAPPAPVAIRELPPMPAPAIQPPVVQQAPHSLSEVAPTKPKMPAVENVPTPPPPAPAAPAKETKSKKPAEIKKIEPVKMPEPPKPPVTMPAPPAMPVPPPAPAMPPAAATKPPFVAETSTTVKSKNPLQAPVPMPPAQAPMMAPPPPPPAAPAKAPVKLSDVKPVEAKPALTPPAPANNMMMPPAPPPPSSDNPPLPPKSASNSPMIIKPAPANATTNPKDSTALGNAAKTPSLPVTVIKPNAPVIAPAPTATLPPLPTTASKAAATPNTLPPMPTTQGMPPMQMPPPPPPPAAPNAQIAPAPAAPTQQSLEVPKPMAMPTGDPDSAPVPLAATKPPVSAVANAPTQLPSAISPNATPDITLIYGEAETDLPLAEQTKLQSVADKLAADKSLMLNIVSYASGTSEQAGQATRTSLARGLGVRRFFLDRNIARERINVRPLGNKSDAGVPDRVDVFLDKASKG